VGLSEKQLLLLNQISVISVKSYLIAREVRKDERRILAFSMTQAFELSF
jgi:hypothetical protein